ncbi:hypothetical protein MMC21_001119 [Puttea exsequens]|nr:hypothetical protein [Puttea exsequens]
MAGHKILAFRSKKTNQQDDHTQSRSTLQPSEENQSRASSSEDDALLATPSRHTKPQTPGSPIDAESYFNSLNSLRSSRANSVYSLSRISLSSQLSQLTSLALPNATSLSTGISAIPTASIAANTLGNAADQVKKWLSKACEVLGGLDAEDDVEWAAAGGREGLEEADAAIGKFEGLIGVYVTAIEDLQERPDIAHVPREQLRTVVDQMETVLKDWDNVKQSLRRIKSQVELAMEWEELWNVVLGEIGLEMENLSRLVFEMEEARHKALLSDPLLDANGSFDIQELDTIVEEGDKDTINNRIIIPSAMAPSSPMTSPTIGIAPDDTRLLALFARMQPLRASLDFLPMTLSSFRLRAESVLPTACHELDERRKSLEKRWKSLESDAEGLRQELGEDRWVVVFRNAGRQAQKLCDSVERAITKLQESIDAGTQHKNPPLLAKKMEAYEAKKSHFGPAIEKVLSIVEKGIMDRLTVNGEILRLQQDIKARWQHLKVDMRDIDLALEDLTSSSSKNQQLRDSISSIVSMDRSVTGSTAVTPGSSPASSVVMGPTNGHQRDASPAMNGTSRRGSLTNSTKRYFSGPAGSTSSTSLPRRNPALRSFTADSRGASPSPYAKQSSVTPTPGSRLQRPSLSVDNKPRWNSSPKVDYFEFGSKPKHLPFSLQAPNRRDSTILRSPSSMGSHQSGLPLPSPLGRSSPAPFPTPAGNSHRPRLSSGTRSCLGTRQSISSPPTASTDWVKVKEKTPPRTAVTKPKRQSLGLDNDLVTSSPVQESPSARPWPHRPGTSSGSSRRISMLPVPRGSLPPMALDGGNESDDRSVPTGRESVLGSRPVANGRKSSIGAWPGMKG